MFVTWCTKTAEYFGLYLIKKTYVYGTHKINIEKARLLLE